MPAAEHERPDREQSDEQDQRAWNLPGPPLVPVGPALETRPEPEDPGEDDDEEEDESDA